ncbi:nicotinamide riboside transporter PnuC [Mucilaginibacter sp. BJC16-A38]|uniref:nicotinamide riboside transporter PnuC n=1 Tax=Mucilaginibacter phenanthrenivorans TaxID=1234842 RepID=UPI002157B700|nr:nicotinamide riboside transporter PnuC [Mucilaginibacter phenanthrenivorans]MCR8561480.1 nicotinamide riboside transporter PnuC [Mucilaginibacter phenanthrenivorans]
MQIIHTIEEWLKQQTLLETTGVITGLLCVYLAARNKIWNWPLAIISVGIYIFIFYDARLYADMGLQFYFMAMNIYGWYFWSTGKAAAVKTPVVKVTPKQIRYAALIIALVTPALGFALVKLAPILHYTPASFPYLDSFCTACSLIAQVFLARKILENWLLWVFVDIIYVGVYIFKGLDLTAIMYAVYVAIALMGYIDWRKEYNKQTM